MFFLNLSLPEFVAILSTVSAAVVALYLLDRARTKHTVATLRFFTALDRAPELPHRRKLQQPWSLVLQLLSIALLLLAISQLRLGSPEKFSRDHVLILDSSAWMSARTGNGGTLMMQARAAARKFIAGLAPGDRVMLVRADAVAAPATVFESDRRKLLTAINETQPGASVLNIDQALEFAQQAQKVHSRNPGEIVYIGGARTGPDNAPAATPPNLRRVALNAPTENIGLRKVSVSRPAANGSQWEVFVALKNYGQRAHTAPLVLQFGGSPVGSRQIQLAPGAEESATIRFPTNAAGWLEVRLLTHDAFPADDRALLELPQLHNLTITVYSDHPEALRPLFTGLPSVTPEFLPVKRYSSATNASIVLLDHFAPPQRPKAESIWIDPPASGSPIAVKSNASKVKLTGWDTRTALGRGLHAKDSEIESAQVFRAQPDDIEVAQTAAGPIIVARPGPPKMAVFGFNPAQSAMKYELSTPLLFANLLHWMSPDAFTDFRLTADTPGAVDVELETPPDATKTTVTTENGQALPFTTEGSKLRFFSGAPGLVRVSTGNRELVYSLTLPQAGETVWKPQGTREGLPPHAPFQAASRDIWQWLALAAGIGFLAEWLLFGSGRRRRGAPGKATASRATLRRAS